MTTSRDRLEEDIRNAMRSRNQQRLDALRFLKSKIQQVEVDERKTLDEAGVLEVITRQVKERRDSIRAFEEGHRDDLVAKESAELAILEEYMPPQMSREELTRIIQEVMREVGAESVRDKGKVMGRLMPQVRGKADGAEVNNLVTELLESGS
ncbi:MAG: GatB/YqeY domain-containing protein [Dehalococcoidia bacterium]